MPTLKQFIYGDGMYMTGELEVGRYYGHTDSGFLRQILYGGVSYALVCFAVTFYFVRKVALNWFDGSWKFILSAFVIWHSVISKPIPLLSRALCLSC